MTDLLLSPLNGWHIAQNAKMVPFAGMSLPVQYTAGIKTEHLDTRQHASLFDISHMVLMKLSVAGGIDALITAVQGIFPIDFARLQEGQVKYSFLLNEAGGILDDIMLSHWGNHLLIVGNGARRDHDPAYLQSLLPSDSGVALEVIPNKAVLAVQGPKAVDALARLIPEVATLSFMRAGQYLWQQQAVAVFRQGYSGEDGYELIIDAAHAEAFVTALCADDAVRPAGLGARDSLRIEAGLPLWGQDIHAETTPIAASLGFAIAKARREAADFLGGKTIAAQLQTPPTRTLCGLTFAGKQPARGEVAIHAENAPDSPTIGQITSGGFSPSLGVPIALAYVDAPHNTAGSTVFAEVRGKMLEATLTALPFVAHQYVRAVK